MPERSRVRQGTQQRLRDALRDPHRVQAAAEAGLDLQRRIALDELDEAAALTQRDDDLHSEIRGRAREQAPALLELAGCGVLTAAKLLAETAGWPGSAPRTASPRTPAPPRSPRPRATGPEAGCLQEATGSFNLAMLRMALTQARTAGPGPDYYQREQTEGHTKTEALRALKRKIARAVYTATQPSARTQPYRHDQHLPQH